VVPDPAAREGGDREPSQLDGPAPVLLGTAQGGDHIPPVSKGGLEQLRPQAGPAHSEALPPGKRPQVDVHDAPCQGLAEAGQHEQVGRPREDEPARRATGVAVHGAFDRDEQVSRALHLVQHHRLCPLHQALRALPGLDADVQIVKGKVQVAPECRVGADKGSLARLTRP